MEWNKVYVSDALAGVQGLPDQSVQCCVTSPPYFRQRDYGVAGQWGQEESPAHYIEHLVALFREVRRVLVDTGTIWVVLGDSYAARSRGSWEEQRHNKEICGRAVRVHEGIKQKDLLGMPWMVALALRKDGWYLRQDIIWFKTNPMPESVRDRCTRSHEYIFMLSKCSRYYYDRLAIAATLSKGTLDRLRQRLVTLRSSNRVYGKKNGPCKAAHTNRGPKGNGHGRRAKGLTDGCGYLTGTDADLVANRKSVWPIATAMSKEEHFASFPKVIPDRCIRATSREGDMVLDPFSGTGTTLLQASLLGRRYIGFDLNPKYVAIAQRRLKELEGIFYRG